MAKKVANQLVETLIEAGVKRIYAVTGDSLNEVNEAVRQNEEMKWIHVRHEETGAYAAGAEAQLTGLPGCCAGSSGPGHVHLINGLYALNAQVHRFWLLPPLFLPENSGQNTFRKQIQSNCSAIAVITTKWQQPLNNFPVCCNPRYKPQLPAKEFP